MADKEVTMTGGRGLQPHPPGSREKFWLLWARRRAMIQAIHDPVAAAKYGEGARQATQRIQDERIAELERVITWAWEGELGDLWRWADRVDQQLLVRQLEDLALIQADDCRVGSGKWLALEGVMGMLGGLRDWLDGRGEEKKKERKQRCPKPEV